MAAVGGEGGGGTGEGITGPPPQSGARLPCLAEGPVFPLWAASAVKWQ